QSAYGAGKLRPPLACLANSRIVLRDWYMKFVKNGVMVSRVPGKPPGAYRVLHTADWHLGKLLGEHSREEEHRRFLAFLLDAIREHSIDALLIAGDVFDSANPPQRAVAQYYDFLSALFRQGGCSVVIVAGNHDSPAH